MKIQYLALAGLASVALAKPITSIDFSIKIEDSFPKMPTSQIKTKIEKPYEDYRE